MIEINILGEFCYFIWRTLGRKTRNCDYDILIVERVGQRTACLKIKQVKKMGAVRKNWDEISLFPNNNRKKGSEGKISNFAEKTGKRVKFRQNEQNRKNSPWPSVA